MRETERSDANDFGESVTSYCTAFSIKYSSATCVFSCNPPATPKLSTVVAPSPNTIAAPAAAFTLPTPHSISAISFPNALPCVPKWFRLRVLNRQRAFAGSVRRGADRQDGGARRYWDTCAETHANNVPIRIPYPTSGSLSNGYKGLPCFYRRA